MILKRWTPPAAFVSVTEALGPSILPRGRKVFVSLCKSVPNGKPVRQTLFPPEPLVQGHVIATAFAEGVPFFSR